jgi:DnaA family protein
MVQPKEPALRQLPLSMVLDEAMTWGNWLSRPTTEALEQWLRCSGDGALLHGEPEVGKSHLLQALCHETPDALYLPLAEVLALPPMALLEGAEAAPLIALDGLDAVAQQPPWQEALFHLFNRTQQTGARVLVAARLTPAALPTLLPDLRSRLEALPPFHLPRFVESDLDALLALRAQQRGLALTADVRTYLLRRGPRTPAALLNVLSLLDREALARQRAVTIPLITELRLFPPGR